jgi:putative Holliday junction resolvase
LRVIGIDYGDVRTGIAVSDPTGTIATGLKTIVTQDLNKLISEIKAVIEEYKAEKIVVGFPRNMNGTLGIRAEKTQSFIDVLTKEVRIPVIKWDERLSSVMAHRTMHEKKKSPSKNKEAVDRIAACYILQSYLG